MERRRPPSRLPRELSSVVGLRRERRIVLATKGIGQGVPPPPPRSRQRRCGVRRSSMTTRLFIRICESKKCRFAPGAPEELKTCRQAVAGCVAHRDGNRRISGRGCQELVVVAVRRVEVADQPRRVAPGWIDERVEA